MPDADPALGGDDEAIPPLVAAEPFSHDLLRPPGGLGGRWHGIDIGRIEEIDAGLRRLIHDGEGGPLIALMAERHCPKTDLGYLQSGVAHATGFHEYSSTAHSYCLSF